MFRGYFGVFDVKWRLGKMRCCSYGISGLQFLLATCRGLSCFSFVKLFKGFFQEYPRYFEGVPLGYEEFVFDVLFDTTRDVAKPQVKRLS